MRSGNNLKLAVEGINIKAEAHVRLVGRDSIVILNSVQDPERFRNKFGMTQLMDRVNYKTIDEYIATFPKDIQKLLKNIRQTIKKAAPEATEKISYQIPTFYLNGNLVHFAAFRDHISFFPTGAGVEAFKDELGAYKTAKGTIQFPLDEPIPLDLIARITKYRVEQNKKKMTS